MASIQVRGARVHNLAAIDVDLPLGGLCVVTGVSGSGKSSLVFDTLHAEGRRRYLEALDAREGGLRRPAVDTIDGLPPTVALRQHTRRPSARESVGDLTEIRAVLGVAFARGGVQHDPDTGDAIVPTPHDAIIAELLAQPEGTRLLVEAPLAVGPDGDLSAVLDEAARAGFSRVRLHDEVRRIDELGTIRPDPDARVVVDRLKLSAARRPRLAEALRTAATAGRGVIVAVLPDGPRSYVDRPYNPETGRSFPDLEPALFSPRGAHRCTRCDGARSVEGRPCPDCAGTGLGEVARAVRLQGRTLVDVLSASSADLLAWLPDLDPLDVLRPVVAELRARLTALVRLGLGELAPVRTAHSLSGGEWRRVRLARLTGQPLSGVVYILDEPTAGLAEDAVGPVLDEIQALIDGGNSVIAVSHREALVRRADHLVELGPGAGVAGGRVVYAGPIDGLGGETRTARWLAGELEVVEPAGRASGDPLPTQTVQLRDQALHVELVPGLVHAVTGSAGAGRTSVLDALELAFRDAGGLGSVDRLLRVEDARVGSARSLVATFVGVWDVQRDLLSRTAEARIRGLTARTFSLATSGGRCESCRGLGEIKVDLGLLPPIWVGCTTCDGARFQEDVLDIRWKGLHAGQLLDLNADQAHPLLAGHPQLERRLRALRDVGLGYIPLGQSTASLSGGEAARLRLAKELGRSKRGVEGALVLVDDPAAGLHPEDALAVIRLLQRLAASGAVVVAASADPLVLRASDRVLRI